MVEKIKALCKEKGTSMYKLEKELNLGNGTIGKWGKNGRVPNYANLSAVASALGVTVAELTGEADEKGIKKSPSTDHSAEADELRAKIIASLDGLSLDTLESLSAQIDVIRSRNKPR